MEIESGTEADFRWRAYQCRTNADAFDLQAASTWDLAADALRDCALSPPDAGEVRTYREGVAGECVEALFADLRGRKFLKYLFAEDPDNQGAYGYIDHPLDLGVQQEIAEAWRTILAAAIRKLP